MQSLISGSFTNVQLELLKLFAHQVSETDLINLKKNLALHFSQILVKEADKAWVENDWNDDSMGNLLNTKMRKNKSFYQQ